MDADKQAVNQPLLSEYEKADLEHGNISETRSTPLQVPPKASWSRLRKALFLLVLGGLSFHVAKRVAKPFIHLDSHWHGHPHSHKGKWPKRPGMLDALFHDMKFKEAPHGHKAEELFLSIPNEASALEASRQYAGKPHLAGSDGDLSTAEDFLALLQREFSIPKPLTSPIFPAGTDASRNATLSITEISEPNAWIDIYYPVMNTPLDRSLQILGDDGEPVWTAELEEVADETDSDAWVYRDAVPTWHGLSRGGEVEGKLIYVNYGTKEDYDALVEQGVNFTGSIVLARYGAIFRGLKIKGAQELGAAGCLIYSDPRDDGSVTVENGYAEYPHGPARNANSVQRGSVQFLSLYPGDPTTPGYPAYENITRTEGENIPKIPSLPISWANAQVLLKEIKEGGANRTVKLVNHVDDKVMPIWNTMGVIPGHIKDEVVIVGNHRDAWVLGAADPSSGTASVVEVVRGLGALVRAGWKPLRTIVIASWDAEEYGLVGSTEWGEDFADWIDDNVVAYLNVDVSVGGSRWNAESSPSLAHFVRSTAEEIAHPTDANRTLWDAREDTGVLSGPMDAEFAALQEKEMKAAAGSIGVGYLGSGSDYTVFLQHIGVASTSYGFGGGPNDPIYHYHSIFDSQRWQELYADPGFHRHVAVAKHLGLQIIRMADSIVLPFNTTHYAFELEAQLEKVELLASETGTTVNLAPLRASIKSLQLTSIQLDAAKAKAEYRLNKLIRKWRRHMKMKACLKKIWKKIKGIFKHHKDKDGDEDEMVHMHGASDKPCARHMRQRGKSMATKPRIGRLPEWRKEKAAEKEAMLHGHHHHGNHMDSDSDAQVDDVELLDLPDLPDLPKPPKLPQPPKPPKVPDMPDLPKPPKLPQPTKAPDTPQPPKKPEVPKPPKHFPPKHRHALKKFIKAAKEVQKINEKLASFERGLIHEDGIKDREWYRNIAIAPGKWLGYGATPLPALTEAITIERNATLAEYEAARLQQAIELITKSLQV